MKRSDGPTRAVSESSSLERLLSICAARDPDVDAFPMVLLLEDLSGEKSPARHAAGTAQRLAETFRAWWEDVSRTRATRPEDVQGLVEVLAFLEMNSAELPTGKAPASLPGFATGEKPLPATLTAQAMYRGLSTGRYIRVVNFHNTPLADWKTYDALLASLARRFSPVTERDLEAFIASGVWPHVRPGIMPVFYEGTRNQFDVALPLLEKYGLVGWFFVIPGFIDAAAKDQRLFADEHTIAWIADEYPGERIALSWDELRQVSAAHVVASHTLTHAPLTASPDTLRREIIESKERIEACIDRRVTSFAWLYGSAYGENRAADSLLCGAGYHQLFSNLRVQALPR